MKRLLTIWVLAMLVSTKICSQVATVVKLSIEVENFSERSAVCRFERTVMVRSGQGASQANFVAVCSPRRVLAKFSGQVTDIFGRNIRKIHKSDLTRSEYTASLADDYYYYYFEYKPTNYPVLITYKWEEKLSGSIISYPLFAPQSSYDVDVVKATYHLINHSSDTLRWQARNCVPNIKRTENKGRIVYDFTLDNLPAIPNYTQSLPFDELTPMVYFAPSGFSIRQTRCDLSSWESLGLWAAQLIQGRDELPEPLRIQLHQMTDTCSSARSKVEVIRKFMGETTRYVSIQLGIGGWQPMSAAEVYAKGIGDCKALSNYLRSMLREVGIKSVYTLISSDERQLMKDFPTMNQLNHVVLMVPLESDTMWIECTNPRYPAGYVPSGWADHEAILVTMDGGKLLRVPAKPDSLNREIASYDITLDNKGNAHIKCTSLSSGICFENDDSFEQLDSNDRRKSLLNTLHLPQASILSLDVKSNEAIFSLRFEAESDGYARISGTRMFIPLSPYIFSSLHNAKEPPHAIDLRGNGYLHIDTIRFTIPDGWDIESLPRTYEKISCFGTNKLNISPDGRLITVVVYSSIKSGLYSIDNYDAWFEFRKVRSALTKPEIVLRKSVM